MRSFRRIILLIAVGALGVLTAGVLAAQSSAPRAVTSLDGTWSGFMYGGTHNRVNITGSLEGSFTITAAESFSFGACSWPPGSHLATFSRSGSGTYAQAYTSYWYSSGTPPCGQDKGSDSGWTVTGDANTVHIGSSVTLTRVSSPTPSTPTTPTTTTTPKPVATTPDTKRPTVEALSTNNRSVYPGDTMNLRFRVTDNSGRATAHVTIYDGGTAVNKVDIPGVAKGQTQTWRNAPLASGMKGPAFFCLWAEDASGNRSAKRPRSDCAWISLIVPVEWVSNGCGGAGWDIWVWAQNYMGNKHTYMQSLRRSFEVDFAPACNIHDAGYGGHSVVDSINRDTVHFRLWSRKAVDDKFYDDMKTLCRRAIPDWATKARDKCFSRGGTLSVGAQALSDFVHKHGWRFFDADVTKPGQQTHGHRRQFD